MGICSHEPKRLLTLARLATWVTYIGPTMLDMGVNGRSVG